MFLLTPLLFDALAYQIWSKKLESLDYPMVKTTQSCDSLSSQYHHVMHRWTDMPPVAEYHSSKAEHGKD